jgi:Restriction endonuclease S subunits
LKYYFKFHKPNQLVKDAAYPSISLSDIGSLEIDMKTAIERDKIVSQLQHIEAVIALRQQELQKLDELVKARFVELFGDLKSNSKHWKNVGFTECAAIDTNMIHDFNGYEDYPHIGIDSIEKETGRLSGYRTIAEDGVISGKYLFTPQHIIYSKIRPNLNKVALPDFEGLCSADAYPILVNADVCTREYLGYAMRSSFFLDYILAFSNRTNLPKVNKAQVEGFSLPLPPMELQNQFVEFIKQLDKSKVVHIVECFGRSCGSIFGVEGTTK